MWGKVAFDTTFTACMMIFPQIFKRKVVLSTARYFPGEFGGGPISGDASRDPAQMLRLHSVK